MADDLRVENLRGAIDLGGQTLKSLILVNGGAAAGLLTLYGNFASEPPAPSFDKPAFLWAMTFFGGGLVVAVLASTMGYLSQLMAATNARGEVPLRIVAILLALASAICFAVGVFYGVVALP